MSVKPHLYRIADLVAANLCIDFFNWDALCAEVPNLSYLDDHTLDMIQANVLHATSIQTPCDLTFDPYPDKMSLIEVVNYLGGLTIKPPPAESIGARDKLFDDFKHKQIEWGADFHLLLTIILVFDKSGNEKLERAVYALADMGYRILREGRAVRGS